VLLLHLACHVATGERDSLKRQLAGVQRKLSRRNAAAERSTEEEQELLRLRDENESLRGVPPPPLLPKPQ